MQDGSTGAELVTLSGHTAIVTSGAFSTDGTWIVSGSDEQSVRVWDASTGTELATLNGHSLGVESVAFSPDCTRIVFGSSGKSVRMWDAFTCRQLATLNGHIEHVTSVAFSTDGTRIVSDSDDRSVRMRVAPVAGNSAVPKEDAVSVDSWDATCDCVFTPESWIVSPPHGKRLMWVPPVLNVLGLSYCHLIMSRRPSVIVDFTGCRVGTK